MMENDPDYGYYCETDEDNLTAVNKITTTNKYIIAVDPEQEERFPLEINFST